jgi:hypothetical protein
MLTKRRVEDARSWKERLKNVVLGPDPLANLAYLIGFVNQSWHEGCAKLVGDLRLPSKFDALFDRGK